MPITPDCLRNPAQAAGFFISGRIMNDFYLEAKISFVSLSATSAGGQASVKEDSRRDQVMGFQPSGR